jgi:hypothetical protein
MTKQSNNETMQKKSPSDEYKALVRAAEAAKKQAELLGVPYVTKSSQSDKARV